jgi:chromosome partitioning protein
MYITIAGFKGGVGKTTTAVHLAAYLQQGAATLLIDGDPNRSATGWKKRGSLPFDVVDERSGARHASKYQHVVIDTKARPENNDLAALVEGCDLLIVPTTPDAMALEALLTTVEELKKLGSTNYRILLSIVHPNSSQSTEDIRKQFQEMNLPVFKNEIRQLAVFKKAALLGVPVYDAPDPRAKQAWADYERVGKEIV